MTENIAPNTQADALAALEAHKSDPAWGAKLLAGDAAVVAESNRLHQTAYADPGTSYEAPTGSEAAQQRIAQLKQDPAWVAKYLAGDPAANKELEDLSRQAHPEGADSQTDEPINPAEYRVPLFGLPTDTPEELQEAEARQEQVRGWLQTAQIPVSIGNSILHQAEKTFATWRDASDAERQAYSDRQEAMLDRMWGDTKPAKLKLVAQLIRELDAKSPGVIDMLSVTGAGSNAHVISSLALTAEQLLAKKGISHG
ncbi:hypothetical protein [Dongia rigui]|uniref:Uncharacterized protein n=1 Tax=Dongia rigui TaxID=940149 RepID=A0ABU5DZT6_9PROT|nr:hypothetical protein [Dongia rigui]MDY0872828.1 hypothetical protein [Dongia rigui]